MSGPTPGGEQVDGGLAAQIRAAWRARRPVELYERRMAYVAQRQFDSMMASDGAITPESRRLGLRWMRAFRKAQATGVPFYPRMVGEVVCEAMAAEAQVVATHRQALGQKVAGVTIYPQDAPSPTAGIPYRPSSSATILRHSDLEVR